MSYIKKFAKGFVQLVIISCITFLLFEVAYRYGVIDFYKAEIKVLNRWGSLVYNYQSEKKFWDGTYEGKDLPSADYYYIINVPGTNIKMNGVISLKR